MKVAVIRDAFTSIKVMMGEKVAVPLGLKIRRIYSSLRQLAEDYGAEVDRWMEEYGERDEAGRLVRPSPTQVKLKDPEAFAKAVRELDEQEVEWEAPLRLEYDEIKDMELEGWVLEGLITAGILDIGEE